MTIYLDGEPCSHPGCASHISHACEGCGRIGARGKSVPTYVTYKGKVMGECARDVCSVASLKGEHCPEVPVHTVVFDGREVYLCEKCYKNVMAGVYSNARRSGKSLTVAFRQPLI